MKKISHEQSRRNAARRRRRVAARHARAGHWSPQPWPVFGSGPVSYEIGANIDATCFGGIAAVHRLAVYHAFACIGLAGHRVGRAIWDAMDLLSHDRYVVADRRRTASPGTQLRPGDADGGSGHGGWPGVVGPPLKATD